MSVESLKQALIDSKTAEKLDTNEDKPTLSQNNVYKDPPGRSPGTLDARWGDKPGPAIVHGTAAVDAAEDGRGGMIDRLFDSPKTTAPAEQELVRTIFNAETVNEGHPPHSPMLRRGKVKIAEDESLAEQVQRVTGLR